MTSSRGPTGEIRRFARRMPMAARTRLLRSIHATGGNIRAMARALGATRHAIAALIIELDLTIEYREVREARIAENAIARKHYIRLWQQEHGAELWQRRKPGRMAAKEAAREAARKVAEGG